VRTSQEELFLDQRTQIYYRPDVEVGRMFFDNLGRNKRLNSHSSLDVSLRQLGESWHVIWRRLRVI
jgi:hypothetical protein